jgi:hypothetical protein
MNSSRARKLFLLVKDGRLLDIAGKKKSRSGRPHLFISGLI